MSINDLQTAFRDSWSIRLALYTLEAETPMHWQTDSIREALKALRVTLEQSELEEIRCLGPQEYLLIKPLAPDAGGAFADRAADHVRALDDMGLVVRLD